jgi:hypothetical protein
MTIGSPPPQSDTGSISGASLRSALAVTVLPAQTFLVQSLRQGRQRYRSDPLYLPFKAALGHVSFLRVV